MDKKSFPKKEGTTNHGSDYEDIIIADLILKLVKDDNVLDFALSSNDKHLGSFDDIGLCVKYKNKKKRYYALQLKHAESCKRSLSLESFTSEKGDFSIRKYFESHPKIETKCNFILFTNKSFDMNSSKNYRTINLENEDLDIKISKCEPNNLFNTCERNDNCYKFEVNNYAETLRHKEYMSFIKSFFLYTNQENYQMVKIRVLKEYQQIFGCQENGAEKYLQFIGEWSRREGNKPKLDKKLMRQVIALNLLTPFIRPLISADVNDKMKLLQEACNCFNVINIEEEECEIDTLWGDQIGDLESTQETKKLSRNYQLCKHNQDLDEKGRNKLLWILDKCPLVVETNKVTHEAKKLCPEKKFILLGGKPSPDLEKLSQIKTKSALYNNIITTFCCSIQGKEEISLRSLIEINDEFRSKIKISDLMKMSRNAYRIGEDREPITKAYINRFVSVLLVDIKYIENVEKKTLIVLDGMCKMEAVRSRLSNFNLIKVSTYLHEEEVRRNANIYEEACKFDPNHRQLYHTSPILKKFVSGRDLFVSAEACSSIEFEQICKYYGDFERIHHLRIVDGKLLQWICSKGDTSDLDRFRIETSFTEESGLYKSKPESDINLIISEPGMGKTELLKNIKNNSLPDIFSVFFSSKDITSLCSELEKLSSEDYVEEFFKFILDNKYKKYSDSVKGFIKIFIENYTTAYFWDALDEISTKNLDIIIILIQNLVGKCAFQWVTSRCHLKKQLEKKFTVLSRSIRPLNEQEQSHYIHQRLQDLNDGECIEQVAEKIKSTIKLIKHDDILGVPLQIYILTELFRKDWHKYFSKLENVFSLTELYHHIIDEKFNVYYQEKANIRAPNDALKQVLQFHKKFMFEIYEKAALKALITKEILKCFNVNCDDVLKDIQDSDDSIGLITEVTDNYPHFLHNSYAEYFVATYFVEHHKEIPNFEHFIYNKKFANIRYFFDLLLAKNSPVHRAVLCNNLQKVKDNKDGIKISEDEKGRNPFELACSWGQSYTILDVEHDNGVYIIDNEEDDSNFNETSSYMELLLYLLENSDFSDSNSSPLSYAEKTNSLMAKMTILLKDDDNSPKLKIDEGNINILYYSIKFGYGKILDLFDSVPLIKTKKDQSSLLHLAVTYQKKAYLKKLLSLDAYKTNIDCTDIYGRTPLYKSCQKGLSEMAEMLIASGADVNAATAVSGCTPLHTACSHSHDEIVEILLKARANANARRDYDITPLHVACWNGHHTTVALLLKYGVDIDVKAEDGCSPLYVSSRNNHGKVVALLLDYKADVDLAQNENVTPLFVAAQEGHENNVKLLLEAGADVNIATITGESPLYVACQNGHENVVKMLIDYGAIVNCVSNTGWSPLKIACQQGYLNIVKMLVDAGTQFDGSCEDFSPTIIAEKHGHQNIVDFLQNLSHVF